MHKALHNGGRDVGTLKGVPTMKNKLITNIEQAMLKKLDKVSHIFFVFSFQFPFFAAKLLN